MPQGSTASFPSDDDVLEVIAKQGEVVRVSRKALLVSPVFRDAFQMELLSKSMGSNGTVSKKDEKDVEVEQTDEGKIRINANAQAIRWLFGLLENLKPIDFGISDKDDLASPPLANPLVEALELADKYHISFYPDLMANVLWTMARTGRFHAVTAYAVAYDMDHIGLAKHAVRHMGNMSDPTMWDLHTANLVGLQPWWSLCSAFRTVSVNTAGIASAKWALVATQLTFSHS